MWWCRCLSPWLCVLVIALSFALPAPFARAVVSDSAGKTAPRQEVLTIETAGSVPGFGKSELARYVATEMNITSAGCCQAGPADETPAPPADRVEWIFTTGPSADGAVRTYGFSRAMMERLLAAHHYVTIKARLYRHGEYEAEMLGQVTIGSRAPDPDLSAKIAILTRLLLSYPAS